MSATIGQITLGTLTFLAASFARSRDLISRLLSSASEIYEQCLFLKDLFDFFEMQPVITSHPNALAAPRPIREGFVFENVGFRYPGSQAGRMMSLLRVRVCMLSCSSCRRLGIVDS